MYVFVILRIWAKITDLDRIKEETPIEKIKEIMVIVVNLVSFIICIISHWKKIHKLMKIVLALFLLSSYISTFKTAKYYE